MTLMRTWNSLILFNVEDIFFDKVSYIAIILISDLKLILAEEYKQKWTQILSVYVADKINEIL
jgi:hypothetical protein